MNRDRGISSNLRLYLHLIYPSLVHTHPHIPFHLPLFPPLPNSPANFVSLSAFPLLSFSPCLDPPFPLLQIPWLFSFYLQFLPSTLPPSVPSPLHHSPSFSSASAPLGSCVLVGVVGGLALCRAQSVSAALAHPSAHPAPWSLINESVVVFVYRPLIC